MVVIASLPLCALLAFTSVRSQPEGESCPSRVQVEAALREALGSDGPSGWTLSYAREVAGEAAAGQAALQMEFFAPTGERRAVRRIPVAAGDCIAAAQAMAVIVERTLRLVGWTRGEALPPSQRPPTPAVKSASVAPSPPQTPALPRLTVGLDPALATAPTLGATVFLNLRLRLLGNVHVRLGGQPLAATTSEPARKGTAHLDSRRYAMAFLFAGYARRVELQAGAEVQLTRDNGSTENIALGGDGTRNLLALGVVAGAALALSSRWRLGVEVGGYRTAVEPEFYVTTDAGRLIVLHRSPWDGLFALRIEYVLWR